MTNRSPNTVPSLVELRRLARGLGGVGLSAAWLAGVGSAALLALNATAAIAVALVPAAAARRNRR